jgi:hypothetical protein
MPKHIERIATFSPDQREFENARHAVINSKRWNVHKARTGDKSPHREVSDIWARYADQHDVRAKLGLPFNSVWYFSELADAIEPLVSAIYNHVQGIELGGVLITRIDPHKQVYPHTDIGWHANHYSKYAICLAANALQKFGFTDNNEYLQVQERELFWFDNSYEHYVTNNTENERITLIACIRTDRGIHRP